MELFLSCEFSSKYPSAICSFVFVDQSHLLYERNAFTATRRLTCGQQLLLSFLGQVDSFRKKPILVLYFTTSESKASSNSWITIGIVFWRNHTIVPMPLPSGWNQVVRLGISLGLIYCNIVVVAASSTILVVEYTDMVVVQKAVVPQRARWEIPHYNIYPTATSADTSSSRRPLFVNDAKATMLPRADMLTNSLTFFLEEIIIIALYCGIF